MTNSHFGHNRDSDCINNFFDHLRITLTALILNMRLKHGMNVHTIRATPPRLITDEISLCLFEKMTTIRPSALMSAGTLSRAMTAHAPASSAIRA